jgi:hypothetical protein
LSRLLAPCQNGIDRLISYFFVPKELLPERKMRIQKEWINYVSHVVSIVGSIYYL